MNYAKRLTEIVFLLSLVRDVLSRFDFFVICSPFFLDRLFFFSFFFIKSF